MILKTALVLAVGAFAIVACKTTPPPPETKRDSASPVVAIADAGADADDASAHAYTKPPPLPPPEGARDVETDPPPAAKSARPADWKDAIDIIAHGSGPCSAVLKREWVMIKCPDMASVALLGGSIDGVMIDIKDQPESNPQMGDGPTQHHLTGMAIFPLRKGDRRVLQFNGFHQGFSGYGGSTPDEQSAGVTLSELWLDGDKGPRLEID